MFKKICTNCNNKINKNYDFCPFCGNNSNSKHHKEDYGILGKNDVIENNFLNNNMNTPFIEKLFGQTLKILEKQMRTMSENQEFTKKEERIPQRFPIKNNIQFFINGKRIFPEENQNIQNNIAPKNIKVNQLSKEKLEKLSKLPKKEPNSKVRRLGARVVYELELPGVNDINDILINRLENSIEIKALSEDTVYSKILNVNLPIIRYGLANGNLILELQGK
jgi:HSP20 family molecular chaperone IbpA